MRKLPILFMIVHSLTIQRANTVKRTYQPSKLRRKSTVGFRARMSTAGGRKVLRNRRRKGRYELIRA